MRVLFPILGLLLLAPQAMAQRWVVKNPSSLVATSSALHSFQFGGDRYVVVDVPRFSGLEASLRQSSEMMVPDARIFLPTDNNNEPPREAWHVKKMRYEQLPFPRSGAGVVVAVLDTGVDYTHQALRNKIWVNPGEIPGNQIDDDHNGFVDDVHGFDFDSVDGDPMDEDQHGTHCSGIIAAGVDPASGARGVAPNARVMGVRIIGSKQMGFLSDAVAGIKYAVDNGAKVLSNSWRIYRSWEDFDPSDENVALLRAAITYAGEHGAIFVAAAGNESTDLDLPNGDPMFPGGFTDLPNLLVVAASDEADQPSYFTNFGPQRVAVAAPGSNIISTIPGDEWGSMSGTSMATPLVAGAIARGLSASFTSQEAMDRLVRTSTVGASWSAMVRAGGVVNLVDYLAQ